MARASKRGRTLLLAISLCALAAVILLPAGASADGGSTWTGAGSASSWSDATNWGGTAPDSAAGTLSFPALTGDCAQSPPNGTCYSSTNNGAVSSATGLSIDDGVGYDIEGDGLTLGSGGLQASTSAATAQPSSINLPITLGADQTWAVDGTNGGQLQVGGDLTGDSQLDVQLTNGSFLSLNGSDEVGAVSVAGSGTLAVAKQLNGDDGQPVSVSDGASLYTGSATIGPLSVDGGQVQPDGTLNVNGSATFDDEANTVFILPGPTSSDAVPELNVSGSVTLAGDITLVSDFFSTGGTCPTLTQGATYTLLEAGGGLSGEYAGVPNGTVILTCGNAAGQTPGASVRIDYTANSVIGTVVSSGASQSASATQVSCDDVNPGQAGDYDECTATVGPTDADATDRPTGTVTWTANSGGGSFYNGSTCTLQPGSGDTSFCSVDYGPAAAIETAVPVTATYGGDANFTGSSGTTSLGPGVTDTDTTSTTTSTPTPTTPTTTSPTTTTPTTTTSASTTTAAVYENAEGQYVLAEAAFGLPAGTVLDTTACYQSNPADGGAQAQDRRAAAIFAQPDYNSTHPNPVTNGGSGIISYCAVNLATNLGQGAGFVVKTVGAAAAGVGTAVGGLGAAFASANPVTGYYIAAGTFPAAAAATVGTYYLGNGLQTASQTTQQDPPAYDYTTVAKPAKVLVPHFSLGAGQAKLAAKLNALILDERKATAVAAAYTTTLNRAGGARLRMATYDEGLQTRAAVSYAKILVTELDYAAANNVPVLTAVAKLPSLAHANFTQLAARLREHIARKITPKERAALIRIGVPASQVDRTFATFEHSRKAVDPLSVSDTASVSALFAHAAKVFEYYEYDPEVIAAAALG